PSIISLFFFSSRRRHTRFSRDWSSDVCSSDLTDRRRAGDRSTRDDDRFLFLQLFTAAQDAFYVSWQGADPRDGSRREPSVLVSELIDVAVAQHESDAADDVAEALVVRHPLQPFSPQAFGPDDEPRRFSYHARWQQAAAGAADRRVPLPPWFAG